MMVRGLRRGIRFIVGSEHGRFHCVVIALFLSDMMINVMIVIGQIDG